jgi:hypothetical protein
MGNAYLIDGDAMAPMIAEIKVMNRNVIALVGGRKKKNTVITWML